MTGSKFRSNRWRSRRLVAVRVWARSTPRRRRRNRRDDPPVGTGRSPLSARWLRSWPPGSRPGRVSIPVRVSRHMESTARRSRAAGSTLPVRLQRAPLLRPDRSRRQQQGPVACHRARVRTGGLGSGNAPGGRVSLVGPATFTGTPVSPAASGNAGAGAAGPRVPRRLPEAPIRSLLSRRPLGSAVSAVGSSVTTATSQIGGSVPAAGSTTGVVNTVVNTLDQAVGASSE